ncbi:hypothetical protein TNCV_4006451 [Trichonephila clavipes]|nr:hypothetical protein TNCV_4006451 [Trichonephila clavipes]
MLSHLSSSIFAVIVGCDVFASHNSQIGFFNTVPMHTCNSKYCRVMATYEREKAQRLDTYKSERPSVIRGVRKKPPHPKIDSVENTEENGCDVLSLTNNMF